MWSWLQHTDEATDELQFQFVAEHRLEWNHQRRSWIVLLDSFSYNCSNFLQARSCIRKLINNKHSSNLSNCWIDATQRKTEVRCLFWCRTGKFCNLRSKQKNCRLTTAEKWAAETVGEAAVTAILAAPQRGHGVGWRWSLWFVAGSLPLGAKHAAC